MLAYDDDQCALTLGFEEPANPALIVAVPLSITTGWFNKKEPESAPAGGSVELMATALGSFG